MTSYTNKEKSATASMSNRTKNTIALSGRLKAGQAWSYGEVGYTYGLYSNAVGRVYYGQVGTGTGASVNNRIKN